MICEHLSDPDAVGRYEFVYVDPSWTPSSPFHHVRIEAVNIISDPGDEDDSDERRIARWRA